MSREVRRVPLDYKHPVKKDPRWRHNLDWMLRNGYGYPKLHRQDEHFIPLMEYADLIRLNKETERDRQSSLKRQGHPWDFRVRYHLTGDKSSRGDAVGIRPFYQEEESGDDEGITVRDEDHLQELLLKKAENEFREFDSTRYMPSFEEYSDDELGYCLYETVSEGTPVTPVFATKEKLVDYLVEHGSEANSPFKREAAESLVGTGCSMASFFAVNGQFQDSAENADKLDNR